jgi:hypothetical protein
VLEIAVASRGRISDLEAKLDERISVLSCQKPTTPAEVRFELDATSCVSLRLCIFRRTYIIGARVLQPEKIIGNVKTTKYYGSRIIELIRSHTSSGTNQVKEASDEHGAKKIKTKDKDIVCVESSEEE